MIYFIRLALIMAFPFTIFAFLLACILSIVDKDADFTVWGEIVFTFNDFVKIHKDTWSNK